MKKFFSLIIISTLLFTLTSFCFADTNDPEIINFNSVIYDEDVAASAVEIVLPKTGGIPAEVFYIAGALIILSAFALSRKSSKAKPTKN